MGGIPEEGIFDWADSFLQQHPNFVELSDRKIVDWAAKSGIMRNANSILKSVGAGKHSLDKPEFAFGIPAIDDLSVHKLMKMMALTVPRDYLLLEVAGNLTEESRAEALNFFSKDIFNRVARVVVGSPDKDFVQK